MQTNKQSIGTKNPFRYRGYYYDTETGLYYLQSRYYDPQVGRFINADDALFIDATGTLLGCNLYAYCENNPVMFVDPLGRTSNVAEASWLVNVLYGSILSLKYSGALLITKVSSMIIAIAPYLFWVAVAVATIVITYYIAKNTVISKADSKIRNTVKKNSKVRYWTATLKGDYVDIGRSISYTQAVKEVIAGRNVFTVTWYEAKESHKLQEAIQVEIINL